MPMQLHELHPSTVHAPLILLPAAAFLDIAAVASGQKLVGRLVLDSIARKVWWMGAGAGLFAGLAGMAASQEIELDEARAQDAMWVHGIGNLAIVGGALGLAMWRSTHRATPTSAAVGGAAVGAAMFTAWLGGELVYTHGAGVKALAPDAAARVGDSPSLLSVRTPWLFVRDAACGLGWLLGRAARLAAGKQPVAAGTLATAGEPAQVGIGHAAASAFAVSPTLPPG